jgi:hypothetical protein
MVLDDAYAPEAESPRVIIVSHGRIDDVGRVEVKVDNTHSYSKQGGPQHGLRKVPTRRDSTDIDWATGMTSRPRLTPRHRLEFKQAIEAYDTAYEQFARLYVALNSQRSSILLKQGQSLSPEPFVPEVYHVHVAYTALMHAYLRLIILERDFWDQKSTCLGVESLFAAYRNFLGHEYRGVADWPIDFDAKLPSMDGYFERLQLQHQMRTSKMNMGPLEPKPCDDGAIEEVSDFEDEIEGEQQALGRRGRRVEGMRRRGSSQKARLRRKASQASSTSAQGFLNGRRRSR